MKGTMLFTDKDHAFSSREVFPALPVPGAKTLNPIAEETTGFLGFGVAITPSSCYELSLMDLPQRQALLQHLYGKDGLGLSVGRLCIGSSDYSPELYSYDDVPFDTELTHFSIERDEAYVIPMIKEILKINPDLYLFASPWSPPGWMKTGGHMCGGYMREQFVDCYADYILKFIEAYAAHGIRISAITPQNEPNNQQKYKMPACVWHPETEAKFIRCLRQKCKQRHIDLKIWMYDQNFMDIPRVLWTLDNCEGVAEDCDGVAFHYYDGTVEGTKEVQQHYPRLELHFTEGGPRLNDHYDTDWCKWGIIICKALSTGYRSFTGWNLMLDECGGPNIGPFLRTCGGLVTRDSRSGELSYSGQYKAFSHIAPYITPNSKIFPIRQAAYDGWQVSKFPKYTYAVEGILIDNGDGKKVAILINPNSSGLQTQLQLDGTSWYLELLADSISTLILEG